MKARHLRVVSEQCDVCQSRPVFVVSLVPFTHERVSYCDICLISAADDLEMLVGRS